MYNFKKEHLALNKLQNIEEIVSFFEESKGLYTCSLIEFKNNPDKDLIIVAFTNEDYLKSKMYHSFSYYSLELTLLIILAILFSLFYSNNISKRKELLAELKSSLKNMDEILANTTEAIFEINILHQLTYMNKKAEQMTGYKNSEIKNADVPKKLFYEGFQGQDICRKTCPVHNTFLLKTPIEKTGILATKNKEKIRIMYRTIPIFKNNSITKLIMFISRLDNES